MSKIIATFTETETGFSDSLFLLTKIVALVIERNENRNSAKAPPYIVRLEESGFEIGTGWFPKDPGKNHINISIDSPELPATIYTRLVKDKHEDVHNLYWDRLKPKKKSGTEITDDEIPF